MNTMTRNGTHLTIFKALPLLAAIIAAGLAGAPERAEGDLITYDVSQDANNHYVDVAFTSPFTAGGPNVDSAELYFNELFQSLFQLSWNQEAYTSIEDMISQGMISAQIRSDSAVNDDFAVNSGWTPSLGTNGIALANVGGIPDLDYETWNPQGQTSGTSGDTLYARLTLSNDLLDGNGNGWSQADVDAGIDAFVGFQGNESTIGYANTENELSPRYVEDYAPIASIIPEPGTIALGLVAAGTMAALRKTVMRQIGATRKKD